VSIALNKEGNVCVLVVEGDLVGANVQHFRDLVQQACAADSRDFVVSFDEAATIDSEGLEALTWLKRECDERLGMVKLCHLSDRLVKILEMTRLNRQFDRYAFFDEALESFA
jgi:anti-anti-sigma factor